MAERSIIVAGSKGGVGTTTAALNVAVHMAQLTQKRVCSFEFARPFGQISLMLDFDPRFTLLDTLERIDRLAIRLYSRASLRGARPASKSWPGHCAQLCAATSVNCYARSAAAHPRLAREAFDPVVVDLGFVNAAEWARVLLSADTLLLVAESGALAWGMLERYLKAADCSRPRSQRLSDHHQSLAPESRRTSRKIRKGSQTILLLC